MRSASDKWGSPAPNWTLTNIFLLSILDLFFGFNFRLSRASWLSAMTSMPVSYTHLTLPTKRIV